MATVCRGLVVEKPLIALLRDSYTYLRWLMAATVLAREADAVGGTDGSSLSRIVRVRGDRRAAAG